MKLDYYECVIGINQGIRSASFSSLNCRKTEIGPYTSYKFYKAGNIARKGYLRYSGDPRTFANHERINQLPSLDRKFTAGPFTFTSGR